MKEEAYLSIEAEWLPADGVTSSELAATWCRLSILIGDQVVTRVEDLTANASRTGIFCSAYPLAEWIATHWWALRSHVRAATFLDRGPVALALNGAETSNALAAHDFRAAGDGFLWPALLIVPEGGRTLLAWSSDSQARAGRIRFVSSGRAWASPSQVQTGLAAFVTAVVDRLRDSGLTETLLEEEWEAITGADRDEVAFCDTTAALGLDPYDIPSGTARTIESLGATLAPNLVSEFAAAADPRRIQEGLNWISHGLRRISHEPGRPPAMLEKLRGLDLEAKEAGRPWQTGWRQAQAVRRIMSVRDTDVIALDSFFVRRSLISADNALQALGSGVSGRIEVVTARRAGIAGQRFMDGRALWRSLRNYDKPYLLTTAATYEQRVERAFAAELLAPAGGLAKLTDSRHGVVLTDEVERLARQFKVSPVVVSHQLENQLGLAVAG